VSFLHKKITAIYGYMSFCTPRVLTELRETCNTRVSADQEHPYTAISPTTSTPEDTSQQYQQLELTSRRWLEFNEHGSVSRCIDCHIVLLVQQHIVGLFLFVDNNS